MCPAALIAPPPLAVPVPLQCCQMCHSLDSEIKCKHQSLQQREVRAGGRRDSHRIPMASCHSPTRTCGRLQAGALQLLQLVLVQKLFHTLLHT